MVTWFCLAAMVSGMSLGAGAMQYSEISSNCFPSALRLRGGGWGATKIAFDNKRAKSRVDKMWGRDVSLAIETTPQRVFFEELLADRFCLSRGFQIIRDELTLSFNNPRTHARSIIYDRSRLRDCGVDLSLPSVFTNLAFTTCGDRICHQSVEIYKHCIASRFASMTEFGDPKPELFLPTGGGTDCGTSLAHVVMSHNFESDPKIKHALYAGNPNSYVLCNVDITTHCGRFDMGDTV